MQEFDHAHIIKLIGVLATTTTGTAMADESFAIVMELAKFGQLRAYLQANKTQIDVRTLILYCLQINMAMVYLEARNYVHRDIAARNVLVFNHECVKLSDFGLAKQIDDVYQGKLNEEI